ncbi:Uncharacterised protein [BD1-7 clade bacterium]|uniref:Gamma-butyrobetaine hydroxylase-like N-terminal domain-containing protein n=1 Tax=BD1-7 clade bacterium TaxID=2029982 RepID=A0A5S9P1Y2_9GAMM|nr:Uncharacterised protein [BD1-7 clade bacterium]CAA0122517.1 Uncharacterised protein [BD1-7 clade bacterium]
MTAPTLTKVEVRKRSRVLHLEYNNGEYYDLSFEFLRVWSPSAEVKGHGVGQETLQLGKEDVQITDLEPVGNYAVLLIFDDGHDSGIFSWSYLYELANNRETYWNDYLNRLKAAGKTRKTASPSLSVVQTFDPNNPTG